MRKLVIKTAAAALLLIFSAVNAGAYSLVTEKNYDKGYAGDFSPEFTSQNSIKYNPWITTYALQTTSEAAAGIKGGEGFQQISDIAICPSDNNLMLLGTDTSGVWRTENGGESWFNINDGVNNFGAHDICFHPSQKNVAYMMQSGPNDSEPTMQRQNRTTLDGVYKTTDGGKSWTQLIDVLIRSSTNTNRLIAFDDEENVYILTAEGLLKSEDEGEGWSFIYSFAENYDRTDMINYDLVLCGDIILFTNSEYGIFVSFDKGETWQQRNPDGLSEVAAYGADIDPEDSTHWFACIGGDYRELYETKDSGESWTRLSTGANASADSTRFPVKVMFGKRNSENKRAIYMLFKRTYTALRVSYDEGATWNDGTYTSVYGEEYTPIYGGAISTESNDANTLYLGVGTVMKSTDMGQTFTVRYNPGFTGANVEEVVFAPSGRMHLSVTDRGFYRADSVYKKGEFSAFTHERSRNYSTVGDIGIDPGNENHIIYADIDFSLVESTDGGVTWEDIENTDAASVVDKIAFHSSKDIIYTTHYTSYDGGGTWTANSKPINCIDLNNDVVYSVSGKELYKSADCGETWTLLYTAAYDINTIINDAEAAGTVWIGLINGNVVKVSDSQQKVFNEENGLEQFMPYAIAQNPDNPLHLVIGGQSCDYAPIADTYYKSYTKVSGIYETFDGGESWHIVKGLPSTRVAYALTFSPNSKEIFIGGFTGGFLVYDYEKYSEYLKTETVKIESFTVSRGNADSFEAAAEATSSAALEKSFTIIIAQFDGGKLLKTQLEKFTVPAYTKEAVSKALKTDVLAEADECRAFVWETTQSLLPLANPASCN